MSIALAYLVVCIVGLLVCKAIVSDANERAQLQELLSPDNCMEISELNNGQLVIIPLDRSSKVIVALDESDVNGVPHTWKTTANPKTVSASFRIDNPDDPARKIRVWMFHTPVNKTLTFSARFVPTYGPDETG